MIAGVSSTTGAPAPAGGKASRRGGPSLNPSGLPDIRPSAAGGRCLHGINRRRHAADREFDLRPIPSGLLVLALAFGALAQAGNACARVLEVGPGKEYAKFSGAVADAGSGDTIRIFPGRYYDCAVLSANHLTVEGAVDPKLVALTDKTCQGKALLVITGNDITIRNLILARARVPDGNGAGIRAEGGSLTVDGVQFLNNQEGILTADNPSMVLTVRNSLFEKNGICGDSCSHAIYAGRIAELHVQNTVFRDTRDGHDIKSRAALTEVTGCDIADGPEGTASYLIEVPNGGALIVRGNKMEKGPKSGNHTAAISIGAEGVDQPTPEITVENNRFVNDGDYRTAFVNNISATEAKLRGNRLSGAVDPLRGDGSSR